MELVIALVTVTPPVPLINSVVSAAALISVITAWPVDEDLNVSVSSPAAVRALVVAAVKAMKVKLSDKVLTARLKVNVSAAVPAASVVNAALAPVTV